MDMDFEINGKKYNVDVANEKIYKFNAFPNPYFVVYYFSTMNLNIM
jgi:hypothetical protein